MPLLFLDLSTRRGEWSAPRPGRFTPGKDLVPIVQNNTPTITIVNYVFFVNYVVCCKFCVLIVTLYILIVMSCIFITTLCVLLLL
jgi:hypothetical protein